MEQEEEDLLALGVSGVHQVCTVGVVQQEAHARGVTIHHYQRERNAEGL